MFTSALNYFFQHYGYWTVFFGVFLESAGVPMPGETILITATAIARTKHQLGVFDIGFLALTAAITGDNLGFAAGRFGGRPLLERYRSFFHISPETIRKGEALFARRGGMAVFFARFIIGMRTIAGPLAGILRMRWTRFLLFNALGAVCWVTLITTLSWLAGPTLESILNHAGWIVLILLALAAVWWWFTSRHKARRGSTCG